MCLKLGILRKVKNENVCAVIISSHEKEVNRSQKLSSDRQ